MVDAAVDCVIPVIDKSPSVATVASTISPMSSSPQASSPSSCSVVSAGDRVLQSLVVDPSIRFGRFFNEPGDFNEKYELREQCVLGTGMSGGVCVALSRSSGVEVAVKTLSTEGLDEEKLDQVRAEITNQLRMDHPHICRLLEVFEEPDGLRLVMERMQGPDLFGHLSRKGRYTERDAAGCVKQMTAAVAYCHRHGVCHRDLKLENFCLEDTSSDARVKLIDFGLSSMVARDEPLTSACGTLYYVAPEVLGHSYDKKCDMWSLGVITYILLDGKPPFQGKDDKATYMLIKKGRYDFPANRWSSISRHAKDFVSALLLVNPARRLDAEGALAHPWLSDVAVSLDSGDLEPLDQEVLESMRSFSKSNALKRAVLRAITPVATVERVAVWADHFEALDRNGDGKVSIKDLARRLAEHGGLSKDEAKDLSQVLAESDGDADLVSYSAFLSACLSAHVKFDEQQLKSLFNRLDADKSGTVSVDEVCRALGNVVDAEEMRREFTNGALTYNDFRWLMSMPGHGPSMLGLRQLLGAYDTLEGSWKVSTRRAKKGTGKSEALEAARRENMAWRVMFQKTKTQRADVELETESGAMTAKTTHTVLSLESMLMSRGLRSREEVDDLTHEEARAIVVEHLVEQGQGTEEDLEDMDDEDLADAMACLRSNSEIARLNSEEALEVSSPIQRRMFRTPTMVLVKSKEPLEDAWHCASAAAKDGSIDAMRRENMLWRKMHISKSRRRFGSSSSDSDS